MHDALGVRDVQGVGELDAQFQDFIGLEGRGADVVLQRLPLQQLHHNERLVVVLADIEEGAQVLTGTMQTSQIPFFTFPSTHYIHHRTIGTLSISDNAGRS